MGEERASIKVRAATAADAPAIVAMIGRLAAHHGDTASITLERFVADGFGPEPRFRALLAEDAQGPLGYAITHPVYNAAAGTGSLELQHLYVEPAHRGRGVGALLIAAAAREAVAHGLSRLALGVREDNARAIAFYEKLGFEPPKAVARRFFAVGDRLKALAGQDDAAI